MTNREPKYQTLLNQLKQRILDGTYAPGSRVPTELEWARTCGVSRITSRKALELAAVQGLVERFARRGTFVRHDARAVLERDRVTARRMIGIIQPDLSDSFGLEFFRTFQTRVQEQGLLTTTGISNDDMSVENRLIKEFLDAGVHALTTLSAGGFSPNGESIMGYANPTLAERVRPVIQRLLDKHCSP